LRLKLGRGAIATTIAATLLIPAVGVIAGPKQRLQNHQEKLADIRAEIESDQSKAKTLREKVDALEKGLRRLQMQIADLDEEVAEIESEVRDAQARIDETQAEIDKVEDKATAQAVALYKSGATETLDALLDAESIGEIDERVEMLGVAAQQNTGALVKFGRLQVEIRGQNEELFDKKDELTARLEDRSDVLAEQTKQSNRLQAHLAELREELGLNKSKERHLAGETAAIKELVLEHQAKAAVASLGTSNRGFIWPLNGGVTSYYGPRWGRMHTGIDINGYTGQPIVAAKEGTVILASYYSGYGNAVIVDHGGGYSTLYAHMSEFSTHNGEYVDQGDIIGYVGCTGSCTGDHLHFEVRVNGEPRDPMLYLP
jgi:murein DD-endopeptidase MepM/ murein hydrolase activator NlpD